MKIKVLGVQIQPEIGNKIANLQKVSKLIKEYSWLKPDLIVLPEVFNTGLVYNPIESIAEPIPTDQTTMFLSGFAEKFNTNIIGGSFLEKCPDGRIRNTSVAFNRFGAIVGKYRKIHMFSHYGSREGEHVTGGDEAVVIDLDFGKVGLSVCYDLRFPELYRKLNDSGAKLFICPAAWPYSRAEHWKTLTRARAIENLSYMIAVNQVGKSTGSLIHAGDSMVIDPWGNIIASAGSEEGVMIAEIDLDKVDKTREEFPVLKDRRPDLY